MLKGIQHLDTRRVMKKKTKQVSSFMNLNLDLNLNLALKLNLEETHVDCYRNQKGTGDEFNSLTIRLSVSKLYNSLI